MKHQLPIFFFKPAHQLLSSSRRNHLFRHNHHRNSLSNFRSSCSCISCLFLPSCCRPKRSAVVLVFVVAFLVVIPKGSAVCSCCCPSCCHREEDLPLLL